MPASLEHLFKKTSGDLSSRYLYCHPDSPDGKADYPRIVNVECLREKANVDIRYHATSNPDGIDMRDMAVSVLYHYNVETLEAFLDTKSPPIKYNHHGIFSRVFIEREGNMLRVRRSWIPSESQILIEKISAVFFSSPVRPTTLLQRSSIAIPSRLAANGPSYKRSIGGKWSKKRPVLNREEWWHTIAFKGKNGRRKRIVARKSW